MARPRKWAQEGKDLQLWRSKHFSQLEECLQVAKKIRDDPSAHAKDRIEAVKIISRLLAGLAPEKEERKSIIHPSGEGKATIDPEQMKKLEALL